MPENHASASLSKIYDGISIDSEKLYDRCGIILNVDRHCTGAKEYGFNS